LDRFLFKIEVRYPSLEEEVQILMGRHNQKNRALETLVSPALNAQQIAEYQQTIQEIIIEDHLIAYIAAIVNNTRTNANLYLGASPRASLALMDAAKALAAINGRDFVTPDDIKKVAAPVIGHRIILTPEREMEGLTANKVVQQIIEAIEIPR
jgi:MoxR-like ATPase